MKDIRTAVIKHKKSKNKYSKEPKKDSKRLIIVIIFHFIYLFYPFSFNLAKLLKKMANTKNEAKNE